MKTSSKANDRLSAVDFRSVDRASLSREWAKESKPARETGASKRAEVNLGKSFGLAPSFLAALKMARDAHAFG